MVEYRKGISFDLKESDGGNDIQTKKWEKYVCLEILCNIEPFALHKNCLECIFWGIDN